MGDFIVDEELKKKILDIIYSGNWSFAIGGGLGAEYYEVDDFWLENEDDVVEEIVEAILDSIPEGVGETRNELG